MAENNGNICILKVIEIEVLRLQLGKGAAKESHFSLAPFRGLSHKLYNWGPSEWLEE